MIEIDEGGGDFEISWKEGAKSQNLENFESGDNIATHFQFEKWYVIRYITEKSKRKHSYSLHHSQCIKMKQFVE